MNFSTSKFCKERKQERGRGKKSPEQKRGVWSLAGERDLSFGILQELVPISLGSGRRRRRQQQRQRQQRRQQPRSAGSDAGRGGRPGVEEPAPAAAAAARDCALGASSARETGARAPSLTPASPFSLTPPRPHPGPLPRAPRHPRALAHAPPRAHTWSARGKVSPAIASPGSCRSAPDCNLELSQCGDTFSSLSLLLSLLHPPPRLF